MPDEGQTTEVHSPEEGSEEGQDDQAQGSGGEAPPPGEPPTVSVDADLHHISGGSVSIAGRDIHQHITLKVDPAGQVSEILKGLTEENLARQLPKPPDPNAALQEKVDYWFQHMLPTDEAMFFVLTLSLFNNLNYPDFKAIYEAMLKAMAIGQDKDEKPRSRFKISSYDLNAAYNYLDEGQQERIIECRDEGLERIIKFTNDQYEAAIMNFVRQHHPDVLLDLLPALKQTVQKYRHWEVRSRAATAVAEIARLGFSCVRREVLEPWANDGRAYVRAAVGYPLARLAEDEKACLEVEKLLDDWTDPKQNSRDNAWRYWWTAASAYKQIGALNGEGAGWAREWAYRGLKQAAGFDDLRVADSVIHSLVVLSLQGQLEDVLVALKGWIEEGVAGGEKDQAPQIRCVVAILAFMVLAKIHIEIAKEEQAQDSTARTGDLFGLVQQSEASRGEYWQLVEAVGVRAFEHRLADAFLDLIHHWIQHVADRPSLQETLLHLVPEIFVKLGPKHRERLLNRLGWWQRQTKDKHLAQMAAAIKARIIARINELNEPLAGRVRFGV